MPTQEEFDAMENAWRNRVSSLEKELAERSPEYVPEISRHHSQDSEPIHSWFGLTYANYLVLPRAFLQSMPHDWQERFVRCLEELAYAFEDYHDQRGGEPSYTVSVKDSRGKFTANPDPHYWRGRAFIPNRLKSGKAITRMF